MQRLTVSQINGYLKSLMDSDEILTDVTVIGEISNFKHHSSGHMYFSLKDKDSAISAAMFRGSNRLLKFMPENGMNVIARGRISVYPVAGTYQLYVEQLSPDGEGALFAAFAKLKDKLESEGLFDASHKRPLPRYPEKIGVVTSPTGAAVRDIISVLSRRFPCGEIVFAPVLVQGADAPPTVIKAIEKMNEKNTCDVMIVGRGGGSIEDLWCFNDEQLARTVAASKIPVISAVGHETDFTLCDFAADMRAPTPSVGAELAVPDRDKLKGLLDSHAANMLRIVNDRIERSRLSLKAITSQPCLKSPFGALEVCAQKLDILSAGIENEYKSSVMQYSARLAAVSSAIEALSPIAVMMRGYSVAYKDNSVVSSASQLCEGDDIILRLHNGTAQCRINKLSVNENGKNDF